MKKIISLLLFYTLISCTSNFYTWHTEYRGQLPIEVIGYPSSNYKAMAVLVIQTNDYGVSRAKVVYNGNKYMDIDPDFAKVLMCQSSNFLRLKI